MVSVVMPVYNDEKYVGEAIESILNQTYADFEFIIIDDASTDRSYQIILDYARQDRRINILRHKKNQGISASRNTGLKFASGEYIAVMDSDDISLPDRLQIEADFLQNNLNYGVVASTAYEIDKNGKTTQLMDGTIGDINFKNFETTNPIIHGSAMYRKECIEYVGMYYQIDGAEDYDLWIRIAARYKIKNLTSPLYKYRVTQNKHYFQVGEYLKEIAQIRNTISTKLSCHTMLEKPLVSGKIKLLLACNHLSTGGGPAYVLSHIQALKQFYPDKYEIYVYEKGYAGIDHIRNQIIEISDHFIAAQPLQDWIKNEKIDIIHYHGWDTIDDRPVNIPSFQTVHTTNSELCQKIADANVDLNLLMNSEQDQYFTHYQHVQSPLDTEERFNPALYDKKAIKEKLGIPLEKPFVLYTGIFTQNKCQRELLRMWDIDNCVLGFLGPLADNFRPYWLPLRQKYESENIRFFDAQINVEDYLAAADIYISSSRVEACSLALLEAMSMAKPIVANNISANTKIIENNVNGLLRGLDSSFIDAIKFLLQSPQDAQRLGTQARETVIKSHSLETFAKTLNAIYTEPLRKNLPNSIPNSTIDYTLDFCTYPKIYIRTNGKYNITILDSNYHRLYIVEIEKDKTVNHVFATAYARWWDEYIFEISQNEGAQFTDQLQPSNMSFKIVADSNALGDNLAWLPYYFDFAEKHNAKIYITSSYNYLFKNFETELVKFENINAPDYNISIGLYSDGMKNDWHQISLQQIASDFLGLEYVEKKKDLSSLAGKKTIDGEYVCIAPHASFKSKEWNYQDGWQKVVDWLVHEGYKVVWISSEECTLQNVIDKSGDIDLIDRITDLYYADFCLGVSSGLSWLAWTVNTHVFMISGFTHDWQEFQTGITRITGENVCRGCFHDFDMIGTIENLCPRNKDFECTRNIEPSQVILAIQKYWQSNKKKSTNPVLPQNLKSPGDTSLLAQEIFIDEVYTSHFPITSDDIVVDIGANIGIFSLYASQKTNNKIFAYEPHPTNYECLVENTKDIENIHIKKIAIAGNNYQSALFENIHYGGHSLSNQSLGMGEMTDSIQVETQTLQQIFEENNIDRINFLKIDCEGAEGIILQSTPSEYLERIDKIAMEFHDNASSLSHNAIKNLLETNGFTTFLKWDGVSLIGYIFAWKLNDKTNKNNQRTA